MPFRVIFSILLFVLLAVLFLAGAPGPAEDLRFAQILFGAELFLIAAGLVMRQTWARWFGLVNSLLLVWIGSVQTISRGSMVDILVLFSGLLLTVILAVPATDGPGQDRQIPEARRPTRGLFLAGFSGLFLALAVAMLVLTGNGRTEQTVRRTAPGEPGLSQVAWNDFATGLEKAGAEGKLMLVDFYAVWCGPCKQMDKVTFRDRSVVAGLQDVIPVRVDAEGREPVRGFRGEELAARYQVISYPTLALVDSRERLIATTRGAMGPDRFLSWLQEALARYALDQDAEEKRPDGLVM